MDELREMLALLDVDAPSLAPLPISKFAFFLIFFCCLRILSSYY